MTKWMVLPALLAMLSSGCLFAPVIECELSKELTQAECEHAVQVTLRMLPDGNTPTTIVVHAGCPGYWRCGGMNAKVIGVEMSFARTSTQALFAVNRLTWDPGPPNFTSPAPSDP